MNREIKFFLDQVCDHVSYRRLHKELKRELLDHLESLIWEYEQEGIDRDTAARMAIEQMGSPADIGRGLNQAHQPQKEHWMFFFIGALVLLGSMVLYTLVQEPAYPLPGNYVLHRYLVYTVVGLALGVTCYFADYRRFEKYALPIFLGALGLIMLVQLSPYTVNGRKYFMAGGFGIAPASILLPFLLISYGGLLKRWGRGDWKGMMKLIGLLGMGAFVNLIQAGITQALLLSCGLLVMLTSVILNGNFQGNRIQYLGAVYGGGIGAFGLYLMTSEYRLIRVLALLNRQLDPQGTGYIYQVIDRVYQQTKWIGRSEGLYYTHGNVTQQLAVPEVSTDMVFTYLVGAFGWLAGLVVILAFILLIGRMCMITRGILNPTNKGIASAILTVFALQATGSILMNLGLIPVTSLSLPFISYGGTNFIMNMMLLGTFLGIHRRKYVSLSRA